MDKSSDDAVLRSLAQATETRKLAGEAFLGAAMAICGMLAGATMGFGLKLLLCTLFGAGLAVQAVARLLWIRIRH